jgi:hypothetical protein
MHTPNKKFETPEKIEKSQEKTEPYQRDYLSIWCKGIMGGCVNCGGCI